MHDTGHVGGAEVELRTVVGEEWRMTATLFLGEDVGFSLELRVWLNRTWLAENLTTLDFFAALTVKVLSVARFCASPVL